MITYPSDRVGGPIRLCFAVLCAAVGLSAFLNCESLAASGSDNAGNYSSWSSGDNQGTGFGAWTLEGSSGSGGSFLGDPSSRASNLSGSFVTSGKTFGLWGTGYGKATRSFASALQTNDRFKITLGYQGDDGGRGIDLIENGSTVFNFNISTSGFAWTGGGSYALIPWDGKRANGIQLDLTFIKTATGFRFVITSPQDGNLNGTGSVSGKGLTGFAVYVYGTTGGGLQDFNFNNLVLDSVPGDVTPPTIALNGDKLVQVAVGGTYTVGDPGYPVILSDDVTAMANIVVTTSSLDTSTAGLKTITYTAKDEANNTASVTRVVLVGDLTPSTADTFYNLHSPSTMTLNPTSNASVYGQLYVKGATEGSGQTPNVKMWVGVNSTDSDPSGWPDAAWKVAAYNSAQTGNNDEYSAILSGPDYTTGNTYYYATRWQVGSGAYAYGGTTGPWNGTTSKNGILSVVPVRNVTFAVDMSVQILKGTFIPSSGQAVELKGSYNSGWLGAGVAMSDPDGDGIYTATVPVQGNSGDTIEYKFNTTGTGAAGWEAVSSNRTLVLGNAPQSAGPVTFSNDGTTFAVWSGGATLNPENLAKYAIGGASSLTANNGQAPVAGGDANTLTLTAIVRDDPSLNLAGQVVTSLADYSNPSFITLATVGDSADQTNLPANCKRKVFSVARGTDERKFLRIKVTK